MGDEVIPTEEETRPNVEPDTTPDDSNVPDRDHDEQPVLPADEDTSHPDAQDPDPEEQPNVEPDTVPNVNDPDVIADRQDGGIPAPEEHGLKHGEFADALANVEGVTTPEDEDDEGEVLTPDADSRVVVRLEGHDVPVDHVEFDADEGTTVVVLSTGGLNVGPVTPER